MAKDVKIEVLYYKTATDISLEFGLHGNYPLRILSSNCNDIDSFFRALKRAVSRSEIILTVGGFNEDDYLPEFIARAIGKSCYIPDYRKSSIIASSGFSIPEGSVPLAPKSRLFGGFLIESGPQTIISLVDDRKIRLDIVNQFIVDYITEHHNVFNQPFGVKAGSVAKPKAEVNEISDVASTAEPTGKPPIVPIKVAQPDENAALEAEATEMVVLADTDDAVLISDDTEAEAPVPVAEAEEITDPEISDSEDISPTEETPSAQVLAESTASEEVSAPEDVDLENDDLVLTDIGEDIPDNDDVSETSENDIYECENYFREKYTTRRKKRIVRLLCIILSLLVLLSTFACLYFFPDGLPISADVDYYGSLVQSYRSNSTDLVKAFNAVKQKNSDIEAWLTFDRQNVYHPIIGIDDITDYKDHLDRLPNGQQGAEGTLVAETKSGSLVTSSNITVYGNAGAGGIFESFSSITNGQAIGDGEVITLADDHYSAQWKVFSCFSAADTIGFTGVKHSFADSEEYANYIRMLDNVTYSGSESDFTGNEATLILVGVNGNEQYIVAAALYSVNVLSGSAHVNDSSSDGTTSDTVSEIEQEDIPPEGEDDTGEIGQTPDTPDIILPPLPTVDSSSSTVTSSESSFVSSSETLSSSTSSTVSTNSSVQASSVESEIPSSSESVSSNTSSAVSASTGSTSSENSSTAGSSTVTSSTVTSSTVTSSSAVSSTPSAPAVDPIYTWDIKLYVRSKKDGALYSGDAVDIVAMIIEIEMSPTIDPKEAVKAQAVAAYNWLLNNGALKESTAPKVSLDPNTTAQAKQYAAEAKGMLVLYGNTVAKTNYYAYSAGKTANTQDIWGGTAYPYLQSVDCSVDKDLKDFETTAIYTADKIKELIKEKCGIDVSNMPKSDWIKPVSYDTNDLYCLTVSIGGKEYKGKYLRETLLSYGIRSSAYTVTYDQTSDSFVIKSKGYGHGVGMSQRGAKAYAKLGWTCEQILTHFFPQTTVVKY